jgi:serine phosphatase RsbU (regulator of sigma subunit)
MSTQQARVLVVDDNEHNRDVLSRRLQRQGYLVAVAEHGRAALDHLQSMPVDLILLDIMMPELNGYQVLAALKADPIRRHIPVIMISAVDDIESVARCIELGAEDYLFKPFNPIILRARIEASLEKKRLRDQEQDYMRILERELAFGRHIQAGFLPETLPQPPGWSVAASFHPAREVAGDFYDAFLLADGRLALVIADVCDKGVGAALYMALIRGLIRMCAELAANGGDDPLAAIRQTNDYITRHQHRGRLPMYATLFFGVLNLETGHLDYINAGHYPLLLVQANHTCRWLETTGPAIGVAPLSRFTNQSTIIQPGELLVGYTDGLIEARQPGGAFFSEGRLAELASTMYSDPCTFLHQIEQALQTHLGEQPLIDDVTLLAIQRA